MIELEARKLEKEEEGELNKRIDELKKIINKHRKHLQKSDNKEFITDLSHPPGEIELRKEIHIAASRHWGLIA